MNRTARAAALAATTALLLAACGGASEPAAGPAETTSEAAAESRPAPAADATEDPAAEDDASAPATDAAGNETTVQFGDETLEYDMDGMVAGAYPAEGRYYLEGMTGVKVLAEVGAEGPAELEAFRESVGADPVSYVRFDVDNREGTEEIGMYNFAMYDADGKAYEFAPITDTTNEWTEDLGGYNDEQWDLSDDLDDADLGGNAAVGERNEQWLVGPADLPAEIATSHATAELFADEFYPMPVH